METGLWNTLELLADGQSPAAVLAEWQHLLNGDFSKIRGLLQITQRQAWDYPCLGVPDCGCRHDLERLDDERWVARCACEDAECTSPQLSPTDLIIHELDVARLGRLISIAIGFEPAENNSGKPVAPKIWPVGTYSVTRSPVYLAICANPFQFLNNMEVLARLRPDPFIVLAPTGGIRSDAVDSFLARSHSTFIPLSRYVSAEEPEKFKATVSIQPILERFAAGLNTQQTIMPLLEGIRSDIASVRDDQREHRATKARLEQMQGENLFKFVQKIDERAFRIMCAVLVNGDVSKAARALDMKDSTLREVIRTWKERGGAYLGLLDLVRWRKGKRITGTLPFNDALHYESTGTTSRESLLADLLDGLLSMTESNWRDVCAELEENLREHVSR